MTRNRWKRSFKKKGGPTPSEVVKELGVEDVAVGFGHPMDRPPEGLAVSGRLLQDYVGKPNALEGRPPTSADVPNLSNTPSSQVIMGQTKLGAVGEAVTAISSGRMSQKTKDEIRADFYSNLRAHRQQAAILPRAQDYVREVGYIGEFLPYTLDKAVPNELQGRLGVSREERTARVAAAREGLKRSERHQQALTELLAWVNTKDVTLQQSGHSIYHNFLQEQDALITMADDLSSMIHWKVDAEKSDFDQFQVFLVEHDWAAAFRGAADFAEGKEFEAPFDRCAFEFKLGGMRWVALLRTNHAKASKTISIVARTSVGWVAPIFNYVFQGGEWHWVGFTESGGKMVPSAMLDYKADPWHFLFKVFIEQIKAISVALEAKVADTEERPVPASINKQRVKHDLQPMADYHVVRLAHRPNRTRHEPDPGREVSRRRMHFRRGHQRHYNMEAGDATHAHQWLPKDQLGREGCAGCLAYRRWIEWQLVGDPDLGFIDKEYRL